MRFTSFGDSLWEIKFRIHDAVERLLICAKEGSWWDRTGLGSRLNLTISLHGNGPINRWGFGLKWGQVHLFFCARSSFHIGQKSHVLSEVSHFEPQKSLHPTPEETVARVLVNGFPLL